MNKTKRARAIAIAQTQSDAKLMTARFLMLATGATAACIVYMIARSI